MADSAVAGLMGAYGHPVVETPTIDKLVESGIRFDTAYCPFPLCAPARATLMTGRHTLEHRLWDNAAPLSSDHPTFAHYLAQNGYNTVLSGTMHFAALTSSTDTAGDSTPTPTPPISTESARCGLPRKSRMARPGRTTPGSTPVAVRSTSTAVMRAGRGRITLGTRPTLPPTPSRAG